MFRRGELVSVAEAVTITGASRQAVTRWLNTEGIDVGVRRLAWLAKRSTNAQRYLEGLPPMRRPTKEQMRKTLDKAMRDFNAKQAGPIES